MKRGREPPDRYDMLSFLPKEILLLYVWYFISRPMYHITRYETPHRNPRIYGTARRKNTSGFEIDADLMPDNYMICFAIHL